MVQGVPDTSELEARAAVGPWLSLACILWRLASGSTAIISSKVLRIEQGISKARPAAVQAGLLLGPFIGGLSKQTCSIESTFAGGAQGGGARGGGEGAPGP